MAVQYERKLFTVEDYYRMAESGILTEDDRVELIEGEIIRMSPIGKLHASCVKRLSARFHRELGDSVIVSVQDPIHLDIYSEPEPDIALLRFREDYYAQSHPTPADIFLIIEVADTSLGIDRDLKLPMYARAGIPEVWIVDLQAGDIRVYSHPESGAYQDYREARRGDTLSPVLLQQAIPVEEIIG
ncbi:MAG: Uma2 family endonuclease [Armatimonadetes bacterium]|nr:Uma2 family endonuclease [Armatimonadota bacterium]